MNIMLVEDDYSLNKAMTLFFKSKGKKIDSFLNGLDAYNSLNNGYDIFIVDIDIPDLNGIELLKEIKKNFLNSYVIIISATVDIDIVEKAYNLGCDDYLKKPFNTKELELKLNLLEKKTLNKYVLANDLIYDTDKSQIISANESIKLTTKESKLLFLLLNNRGRIIPSETILDVVWEFDSVKNQVRQLVSRVNKKLPIPLIINKPGQGYIIE